MTKRAQNTLASAGYNPTEHPVIAALVEFAAQNPGLEWGNYVTYGDNGQGAKAYRQEARSINQDWQRFKAALSIAATEGVTGKEVIEASGAFSGRLTPIAKVSVWSAKQTCKVKSATTLNNLPAYVLECDGKESTQLAPVVSIAWDYCTGQYFPTEYRKAAATVLESAIRAVRQARTPAKQKIVSIADLKKLNEQNGGCWFEAGSMRFFGTRIESGILHRSYFVTSEQQDENRPRKFTVRSFNEQGDVDTVGDFHAHNSKADAIEALREHLKLEPTPA